MAALSGVVRFFDVTSPLWADDHEWNPEDSLWQHDSEVRLFTATEALNESASATVAMTAASTLTTTGVHQALASVSMTATSTLTAPGSRTLAAAVALSAISALTTTGTVSGPPRVLTRYDFDSGSNGANLAAGGDIIAVSATPPTYQTVAAFSGSALGLQSTGSNWAEWATPAADWSFSLYFSMTTNPGSGSERFVTFRDAAANTGHIRFQSTGAIQISSSSNVLVGAAATTTWAIGDDFRFDVQVDDTGADLVVTLRIFKNANIDGTTPDEEMTPRTLTGSNASSVRFGGIDAAVYTSYWDNLAIVNTLEWIGPWPTGATVTAAVAMTAGSTLVAGAGTTVTAAVAMTAASSLTTTGTVFGGGETTYIGGVATESDVAVGGTVPTGSIVTVSGTSAGILAIENEYVALTDAEFRLQVLDPVITRAPSSLTFSVAGGLPETDVRLYIDDVLVWTVEADTDGNLTVVSLNITPTIGGSVGTHEIEARQTLPDNTDITTSGTFSILKSPNLFPQTMGIDADPVIVPGALEGDVRAWVLQDLTPTPAGGIGSWIMPFNPSTMTSPHFQHSLSSRHTTAKTGRFHVSEAARSLPEWKFSGYLPNEEMALKLLEYRHLNRRFYIIDHHNRAWKVVITELEIVPRLRHVFNGEIDDWGSDYNCTAVVLEQDFLTPGPPGEEDPYVVPEGESFEDGTSGGAITYATHPWIFRYMSTSGVVTRTFSETAHGGELAARLYASAPSGQWAESYVAFDAEPDGQIKYWMRFEAIEGINSYVSLSYRVESSAASGDYWYSNFLNDSGVLKYYGYEFGTTGPPSAILEWDTWYQVRIAQDAGDATLTLHDADGVLIHTEPVYLAGTQISSAPYGGQPALNCNIYIDGYADNGAGSGEVTYYLDDVVVPGGTIVPSWDEET